MIHVLFSASRRKIGRPALACTVAALALVLVGCASTPPASAPVASGAGTSERADFAEFGDVAEFAAAVDLLPASVIDGGKLTVVMNVSSAPTKFYAEDNSTIVGLNADISRLIGKTLGLDVEINDVQFDGIIPALEGERYQLAVSSMATSPERISVLDMIDYASWGSALAAASGNPDELTLDNLCGQNIAVQMGSYQESTTIPTLSKAACEDLGKPAINMVILPSQQDALIQLTAGRVVGVIADGPVLSYATVQQPDRFEVIAEINPSTVSLATKKNSELTAAVQSAMQHVLTLPEYTEALSKWGIDTAAISEATLHVE
ncbi:transporter substrate-binding domain-containing protein [Cryobacterium sp. Y82]|uniref:transporter substrate-binding domain-containing protein n=1 Tax=Cryobacterium sp. Y82 TaxID=2045017 RepID=UPI000CE4BB39|nr:transporter substrate-binding domain-containing protein [Cryobacterium sp. Y82]